MKSFSKSAKKKTLLGLLGVVAIIVLLSLFSNQNSTPQEKLNTANDPDVSEEKEVQKSVYEEKDIDSLYVSKLGAAKRSADSLRTLQDGRLEAIDFIANTPTGNWIIKDLEIANIPEQVAAIELSGKIPIFVPYNIPFLGCGTGGAESLADYQLWINSIVSQISIIKEAIVVLEPDAVPLIDCLTLAQQEERILALRYAAQQFKLKTNATVYLDAGHSDWKTVEFTEDILRRVGLENFDGFALNVSNFQPDAQIKAFGNELSIATGMTFIIDSSRNGNPNADLDEWCNAPGASLGKLPTFDTGFDGLDAYLWVKVPGESDAACNGGPTEGQWWVEYAADLFYNSDYDDTVN